MMRLTLLGLLLTATHAHAAWLQACPENHAANGTPSAFAIDANGVKHQVTAADHPAHAQCEQIALPFPAKNVLAIRALPTSMAAKLDEGMVVYTSQQAGGISFNSIEVSAAATVAARLPMPIAENLLPHVTLQTFGAEERVSAQWQDGRLELQCKAGSKPAGVILRGPWFMPQAAVDLQLTVRGAGTFDVLAADAAHSASENALPLGRLVSHATASQHRIAIPETGIQRDQWHSFTLACPVQAASLHVDALQLAPREKPQSRRATWVWQPSQWQHRSDAVIADARRHGIGTLFISVPIRDGKVADVAQLTDFLRRARRQQIDVWAVDGDPYMVVPGEHAATLRRQRAYAAYNAQADETARLGGVQFDIEPYLMAGYDLAAAKWDRQYAALLKKLRQAAPGMPLEVVVPFWWADKSTLMQAIAPVVDGLTVMDYRTDAAEIYRFAVPFLDWGSMHGKRVRIALEAGPVATETRSVFRTAADGQLWRVKLGQFDLLLLLDQAHANPHGAAYRLADSRLLDGSATTFHRQPERLLALLPQLEMRFAAWRAFAGIALHELTED